MRQICNAVVVSLILFVVGSANWNLSQAFQDPDGPSFIALHGGTADYGGIWVMDADGANLQRLTTDGGHRGPVWSPNGSRLVFSDISAPDNTWEVITMNPDGTDRVTILTTDDSGLVEPAWSPDGTQIAFHGTGSDAFFGIWVMDADGANLQRLTTDGDHRGPVWSPDGSRLVFSDISAPDNTWEVITMNPDGTDRVTILTTDDSGLVEPAWSPDGTQIAFHGTGSDAFFGIWVMNADGTDLTRLTTNGNHRGPSWSPDGSRLVFAQTNSSDRQWRVITMDPDGTDRVTILTTDDGGLVAPSWSIVIDDGNDEPDDENDDPNGGDDDDRDNGDSNATEGPDSRNDNATDNGAADTVDDDDDNERINSAQVADSGNIPLTIETRSVLESDGSMVMWEIDVTNIGTRTESDLTVTDTISSDLQVMNVTTTRGFAEVSGQTVLVTVGSLVPGESVAISIITTPSINITSVTNLACLTGSGIPEICDRAIAANVQVLPATGEAPPWREAIRFGFLIVLGLGVAVGVTVFAMRVKLIKRFGHL